MSQKPSKSLLLNCAPAVISVTAQAVSGSTDCGPPTQTKITAPCCSSSTTDPKEALQTTDITMASGASAGHSDQCGPWWQHRSQTSAWLPVVTRTTDINTDLGCSGPWTQTWPQATAQPTDIDVSSGCSTNRGHPCSPSW